MTLFVCWAVFPLVLAALALGCGLLVERLAGVRLPGSLVAGAGLALMIVLAEFATRSGATAELAAPIAVVAAVAGVALTRRPRREIRVDAWAAAAAVAAFCVFAAPTALSGKATFAGYIKLQDTASWVAITDHVMEEGRSVTDTPQSGYESILHIYLRDGYPVGAFLPLGVGREIVGQDAAWLVQPYLAFLAAMLALALYALASALVRARWLRMLVAVFASQAALLFAFSLWGAMKELVAAWLVALVAALAVTILREDGPARAVLPLAVACAAMVAALSIGGVVWLLSGLAALVLAASLRPGRGFTGQVALFLGAGVLLTLPSIIDAGTFLGVANPTLTAQTEWASLVRPLRALQAFGIWPAGDFRVDPDAELITYLLIALVAAFAIAGIVRALAARAWEPLLYVLAAVVAGVVLLLFGGPWTDAKALVVASPALVFAALAGAANLFERGLKLVGGIAAVLIAAGILWSNALAYHEVDLAPRDRFAELERIGELTEGEGPTLTTEFELWSVRHFLRSADAEIGLAAGEDTTVPDIDGYAFNDLLRFRTVVVRRSPVNSRPPAVFQLAWRGRYYEVWQQGGPFQGQVRFHQSLGRRGMPAVVPPCRDILRLARTQPGTRIATVVRSPAITIDLASSARPPGWASNRSGVVFPDSGGSARARVRLAQAGRYQFWVGGSFRARLTLIVDGRRLRSTRNEFNFVSTGLFVPMGGMRLGPGVHTLELRYDGPGLSPGSGGDAILAYGTKVDAPYGMGPLVLGTDTAASPITVVPRSQARSLCGKTLDWLEAID